MLACQWNAITRWTFRYPTGMPGRFKSAPGRVALQFDAERPTVVTVVQKTHSRKTCRAISATRCCLSRCPGSRLSAAMEACFLHFRPHSALALWLIFSKGPSYLLRKNSNMAPPPSIVNTNRPRFVAQLAFNPPPRIEAFLGPFYF